MGETIAAALPAAEASGELDVARAVVFRDRRRRSMAEVVRFLQRHYRFAEGARLHPSERAAAAPARRARPDFPEVIPCLTSERPPSRRSRGSRSPTTSRWAGWSPSGRPNPATRPDVDELKEQLDGIATVPDRIKTVEFVQSTLDHLILRLPVKEMIEESLERMSDPIGDGGYPLPQFYADHYRPGFGPVMTPLDTLLARVGDYTIAQCR